MSDAVEPFYLAVPQADLDDLRTRLARTRWPEAETVGDWSQGAPLARVKALCARWQDGYDWRRCEARLNGWGQHRTVLDGLGIHFLHVRSPEPGKRKPTPTFRRGLELTRLAISGGEVGGGVGERGVIRGA